jgi:catechol 2,3-dioxygenase-like lactoylglutathione lyase family enzyme
MNNKPYVLKLSVRNLKESIDFYKKIFAPLGFRHDYYFTDDPYDNGDTWVLDNGQIYIELQQVSNHYNEDIFTSERLGLHRFEFHAESEEEVKDFYNHLVRNNVEILRGPDYMFKERPDMVNYSKGDNWFAVYFKDNNGMIFGLVCSPRIFK